MNTDPARDAKRFEEVFEPIVAVTAGIRRRLRGLLALWKVADETVEDTLLVVEELVANVIDHARTPFRLVVQLGRSEVQVRIHDGSTHPPQLAAVSGPPSIRGRGLRLVQALSARWGWDKDDDGKTVWATIAVPN